MNTQCHATHLKKPVLKQPVVLVLGGNGFIGRYTVRELLRRNAAVVIGTRDKPALKTPVSIYADRQVCDYREIRIQHLLEPRLWFAPLAGVDVVINAVGILRERGDETFAAVHNHGVAALAAACATLDIPLVHVSALGIDKAVSNEFCASKLRGEQAIARVGCRASIVRASVVDAPDGYGAGWFYRVAQWPLRLLPASANKLLSPIAASDLGEALCLLALAHTIAGTDKTKSCELLEVGCGENFDLATYLQRLRRGAVLGRRDPWLTIRVPTSLARWAALAFDWLNLTPYSIGHHELLGHDNIPKVNALPSILGRQPTRIGYLSENTMPSQPVRENLSQRFAP